MEIKQNSETPLLFLMVDATDKTTPETGLTPTVTIAKPPGVFAAASGTIAEIGNGIYMLSPDGTDTGTLGPLALQATAAGAFSRPMLFEVVSHTRGEVMAAIAALQNLSAAGVRTELATELARIDVAVSSRNATTPPTAAAVASQVRTELATELARVDATISSRNATAPPAADTIADAVWDEALAAHATAGTAGAQLTAAGAAGDPWATLVPAAYASGTAGEAFGAIRSKTDLIVPGAINILSPVSIGGDTITVRAGDTWTIPIAGLGDISGVAALIFAVKITGSAPDSQALLAIDLTGLKVLNKALYGTASHASIAITDEDAGNITITADEAATLPLAAKRCVWGIKKITSAGGAATLATGTFVISESIIDQIS